jgi:hypothetical protein
MYGHADADFAVQPIFTSNKALHQAYTSQRRANEVFDARNNEMFQTATDYVFTQPRSEAVIDERRLPADSVEKLP